MKFLLLALSAVVAMVGFTGCEAIIIEDGGGVVGPGYRPHSRSVSPHARDYVQLARIGSVKVVQDTRTVDRNVYAIVKGRLTTNGELGEPRVTRRGDRIHVRIGERVHAHGRIVHDGRRFEKRIFIGKNLRAGRHYVVVNDVERAFDVPRRYGRYDDRRYVDPRDVRRYGDRRYDDRYRDWRRYDDGYRDASRGSVPWLPFSRR